MSSNISNNKAKLSAAGSGKTWDICHDALETVKQNNKRVLILSFTNRSIESARNEIRKQNDGVLHPRVIVKTWYRFLLSDMIKPYQTLITGGRINHIKSVDFSEQFGQVNRNKAGTYARYINSANNVRSNQASELAVLINQRSEGNSIRRLEEIYSNIYLDEIQDLAGYDLDILKLLMESSIAVICCGDNKQATYATHVAKKNKKLTGTNIWAFFNKLSESKLVEIERNLASRRFNRDICCFANTVFPEGEAITTIMEEETEHDGVYLINQADVDSYIQYYCPQILRYNAQTVVDKQCLNFGACKGETFDRVLIYPNGPLKEFVIKGKALEHPEKYYVGVTRARYSIAIIVKQIPAQLSDYEEVQIQVHGKEITGLKYQC